MASTTCGYCDRLAHMASATALHYVTDGPGTDWGTKTAAYKCPNCGLLNVAIERVSGSGSVDQVNPGLADVVKWGAPLWLPRHKEFREFPDVPEHIAGAASEATLCLSVNAFKAAGALARAVVEATAKDKEAKGDNLAARIDALHEADHIRTHTKEQAHEIRHFGNDMAHGDFVAPVTKEEAEEVVELMAEVLDEVYQSPARLERRKTARLAKKEQG